MNAQLLKHCLVTGEISSAAHKLSHQTYKDQGSLVFQAHTQLQCFKDLLLCIRAAACGRNVMQSYRSGHTQFAGRYLNGKIQVCTYFATLVLL